MPSSAFTVHKPNVSLTSSKKLLLSEMLIQLAHGEATAACMRGDLIANVHAEKRIKSLALREGAQQTAGPPFVA